MRLFNATLLISCLTVSSAFGSSVSMNTDEAEAVLAILEKRAEGIEPDDADWKTLFTSEPYMRLKSREAAMKREFTDDEFRAFVLSDELAARAGELRATLVAWSRVHVETPVSMASAYLANGAAIRATIYPVIKPKTNSFVFEISTNPAIFVYLDPAVRPDQLANTLAHELHHIGFGTHCPSAGTTEAIDSLPENLAWTLRRLGAFGEGFAMLAAAGGPDVHPHEVSSISPSVNCHHPLQRNSSCLAASVRCITAGCSSFRSGEIA